MSKGTRTEVFDETTEQMASLFHPRTQLWEEHFSWSDDFMTVTPLTPTGRVTVAALKFKRLGVRNLRRLLWLAGKHPPNAD